MLDPPPTPFGVVVRPSRLQFVLVPGTAADVAISYSDSISTVPGTPAQRAHSRSVWAGVFVLGSSFFYQLGGWGVSNFEFRIILCLLFP